MCVCMCVCVCVCVCVCKCVTCDLDFFYNNVVSDDTSIRFLGSKRGVVDPM